MRQAGAGNQADAYLTELQVRKRVFLRHRVCIKMPSFYQDRLGTNIGKVEKESGVFA
jgi:hypothetical protein